VVAKLISLGVRFDDMKSLKAIVKILIRKTPDPLLKLLVLALTFEVKRRAVGLIQRAHGFEVLDGPLKGTKMLPSTHGGATQEYFGQAIGTYETPVLKVLTSRQWENFIDIGAESGFYVAGMLAKGFAKTAYSFEINPASQKEFDQRLKLNGRQSEVFGEANQATLSTLLEDYNLNSNETVVLCDIEGGEFSLFTPEMLKLLSHCHLVIEVHDPEGSLSDKLLSSISSTHKVEVLHRDSWSGPFLNQDILRHLSDHEKMLLISEGREYPQSWFYAVPLV
jgi:hypothetical protein